MDIILGIALVLAGFYMAWNIGANDLANAMGTSVGSKSLTIKQVIVLAAIFELAGALLFGGNVTGTIAKGIVPLDKIIEISPLIVTVGMLAAILAAAFWITLATFYNLPVSTTHSIVGSVLGFGIICVFYGYITFADIHWPVLINIVASWFLSPFIGAALAYVIFYFVRKRFLVNSENVPGIEKKFVWLQVATACFIAFAHGSNDVANAIGPLYAVFEMYGYTGFGVLTLSQVLLLLGGVGIVIGLSTWGYKVIDTVGSKITELTPTRGFSAQFATASVVLAHSFIGLPISTTHTLVGAVIGVGLAGGLSGVNFKVIKNIVSSWFITVPVAALTCMIIFFPLEWFFL
ncbi:Sulfate permease CysP [Methanimicrococcus sp. At1]|uniref:Sulfate permease CysP n=1 Tax=Methanimicrococcus hacksteinii TaxID=3028293 RepID=A0ABU3VPX9_9EURY|nr:inorganic phosphate transporter [Methanimicrococcus sp. At1]MDV0444940.1 Sulfate permease CysP [Methanimicrococcus sp. At1]